MVTSAPLETWPDQTKLPLRPAGLATTGAGAALLISDAGAGFDTLLSGSVVSGGNAFRISNTGEAFEGTEPSTAIGLVGPRSVALCGAAFVDGCGSATATGSPERLALVL